MKRFVTRATAALALGLGLMLTLLYALSANPRRVLADPGDLFVTTGGAGTACTQDAPCTLQTALTQAIDGDTIYVAQGTYTGTGGAVVTVTQSITLAGGWDGAPSGDVARDPDAYPSILDGENARRGVCISGDIAPTLDGFIVTGGNASNVAPDPGRGGGIYSNDANPIVTNNIIANNTAYVSTTAGHGGGIYLISASAATRISGNIIISNTANTIYQGRGGGLIMYASAAIVSNNTFQGNVAGLRSNSQGGGIYLGSSAAVVSDNLIQNNKASSAGTGFGGGLCSQSGEITLDANTIISNAAKHGAVTFNGNTNITLTNNVIAQNRGGVFTRGSASNPLFGILVNNTIVQNDNEGVYVGWYDSGYATLVLTDNVIVSHTIGIYIYLDPTSPNVVTATHTLFYDNITDTVGSIITSTDEITGSDPLFVDPVGWDYHVLPGSPAIDAGTTVPWLTTDIDGDVRPWPVGGVYDIGADEAQWLPVYLPLVLRDD